MKKYTHKKAFSLVEIIAAFAILILVVVAATNLLVSVIRSNAENMDSMVAYGLAQEGLEATRNIRDSDWLLGADFSGKVGSDCLWPGAVCLPETVGNKKYFTIDFQNVDLFGGADNVAAQAIPAYAPWKMQDVTVLGGQSDVEKTRLCSTVPDSNGNGNVWYFSCANSVGISGASKKSLFSRYVEVELVIDKKYRVSSVVQWLESGRKKEVRLTTELTDWKGGGI